MKMRVYVDGYNLYYGALKPPRSAGARSRDGLRTLKWLDLSALATRLLPSHEIDLVRHFTAIATPAPWQSPLGTEHQRTYLRALETLNAPSVHVHLGQFALRRKHMRLVADPTKRAHVWLPEEKGSDVNLASHLLRDIYEGRCEGAAIISNDADLREPIQFAAQMLRFVVIVHPGPASTRSDDLRALADAHPHVATRALHGSALRASQLPQAVTHPVYGQLIRPSDW